MGDVKGVVNPGLLEAIHRGRFPPDREPTTMTHGDVEYAERIAASITAWNTRPDSTGKGEGWRPDREVVARIIEPYAWSFYDRHIANPMMGAECREETSGSLRRADAILALPASTHAEEG